MGNFFTALLNALSRKPAQPERVIEPLAPEPVARPEPQPTGPPAQRKLAAWLGGAAMVATALSYTGGKEGTVTHTYRDPVNILTACTGETHYVTTPGDIQPGAQFTKEECTAALFRSMAEHASPIIDCLGDAKLTTGQKLAFLDFAYNAGSAAFCKSSMRTKAVAGDEAGSCQALLLYKLAQGRDCSRAENKHICGGLWDRRQDEVAVCMGGKPAVRTP